MNQSQTDISCEVCLDLIPLVRDAAASPGSELAVRRHCESCESCRAVLGSPPAAAAPAHDERVLRAVRRSLLLSGGALLIIGSLLGVMLFNSMGVFYNFLLLPALGALLVLGRRFWLCPAALALLTLLWTTVSMLRDGMPLADSLSAAAVYAVLYLLFTALGTLIAALLRFAFQKERTK